MSYGYCPSCYNKLSDDSAIITKPSEIFRGNNVYMMCKNCQRIVLYNKDRDMIFDLDEYQDDENVLEEIKLLLEELDPNLEVVPKEENVCTGDCEACAGCGSESEYQGYFSRKEKHIPPKPARPTEKAVEPEPAEEIVEEQISDEDIQVAISNALLAVNKKDVTIKKIFLVDDLGDINVNEWLFFELQPVKVKQKISYEIERI